MFDGKGPVSLGLENIVLVGLFVCNVIAKLGVHGCHELCDLEWTTIVVRIHYLSTC